MTGKITIAGLILILVGMAWFFLKNWVQIPDDYIPTKWSQFYFLDCVVGTEVGTGQTIAKDAKISLGLWLDPSFF